MKQTSLLFSLFILAITSSNNHAAEENTQTAIFAGGCFWCIEADFEKLPGVISVESGYTGGHLKNPTYKQVTYNETGHYEAVSISYDPNQINYQQLIDYFWFTIDPTDPNGQFCDKGSSYRSAVFYLDEEQKSIAEQSLANMIEIKPFSESVVTPIIAAGTFYPAEDYHQNYYKTNSVRYRYYRYRCGRDQRVKELWGELGDERRKQVLQQQGQDSN